MRAAVADKEHVRGEGIELPAQFGEFGLDALGAGKADRLLALLGDYHVEVALAPFLGCNRDALDATLIKKFQKHDMACSLWPTS